MIEKKQARNHLRQMKKDVCRQIRELRYSKNLTLEHLSIETGLSVRHLDKLETGLLDINIGILHQIARFFDKKIKIELVD